MDFSMDFHIHSALSPCGDNDMTPNNIVNMAILKGIDIISVTDHNSTANLPSISKVAIDNGIMLLPGIEVQTREEIHMLCYFRTVDEAVEFGSIVYSKLPDIKNSDEIFGKQLVMGADDNIVNILDKLLLSSTNIYLNQLVDMVTEFRGVCIPAHVDRSSFSIISNLGFIPADLGIRTVEISKYTDMDAAVSKFPYLKKMRIVRSSDAHYLWDISEMENFLSIEELTLSNVMSYLKGI